MAVHLSKHRGQLTVVIKLGTSSIVDEKTHQPLLSILSTIVETACKLHDEGHRVVIVSSGAIGVGLRRMELDKRPKHLPQVQALAAIGQSRLMSLWDQLFAHLKQPIAQILLTRNDIADRTQYQNAQNTFFALLNMGVIPIVNENDTLAVTEIKFGDNDTLSAITAGMVQADYLFLMTDVDCLYDKNPRTHADAKTITVVEDIADLEADVSSAGSSLGTGGMSTKIVAARLATSAGVTTVITKSSKPGNITAIIRDAEKTRPNRGSVSMSDSGILSRTTTLDLNADTPAHSTPAGSTPQESGTGTPAPPGEDAEEPEEVPLHTKFLPVSHPVRDRWFWILYGLAPHGTIYIDHGAYNALLDKAGLLPVGIVDVEGNFAQQEAVRLVVVKRLHHTQHHHHYHQTHNNHHSNHHSNHNKDGNQDHTTYTQAIAQTPNRTSLYENHPRSHTPTPSLSSSNLAAMHHPSPQPLYEMYNPVPFEIGRAVVNYSAGEIRRISGLHSTQIHEALGYADSEYVALRENIALIDVERSRPTTPAFGPVRGSRTVSERAVSEMGDGN